MTQVPWIRLYTSWPRHRKTLALRRLLGSADYVLNLWCWCAENAPTGDLSGLSDEEIEYASEWRGQPGQCVAALLSSGWLDVSANGEKSLHEWMDGAGRGIASYTRKTEKQRELMRERRASSGSGSEIREDKNRKDSPANVVANVSANTVGEKPARKRALCVFSEAFSRFWAAYPRKVSKGQAVKAWPGDEYIDQILSALEWQRKTWSDPQFIKHPSTWLRARCWEDEKQTSIPNTTPLGPRYARL